MLLKLLRTFLIEAFIIYCFPNFLGGMDRRPFESMVTGDAPENGWNEERESGTNGFDIAIKCGLKMIILIPYRHRWHKLFRHLHDSTHSLLEEELSTASWKGSWHNFYCASCSFCGSLVTLARPSFIGRSFLSFSSMMSLQEVIWTNLHGCCNKVRY